MNLGMILSAPYPADMRVKKETDALLKAGFNIFLLCLRKENEAYEENYNGINITRIDGGKNNYELAFWDAVMSVSFRHPLFIKAIEKWVEKNKIGVIHVHDLPLAGSALSLRGKLKLKVVVDLHENYPEALRTWFEWKKGLLVKLKNKIFMNPNRWTEHERTAVTKCDYVIAVVDEMKQRIVQKYGIDSDKVIVVSNTEDKSFLNQQVDPAVYTNFQQKFRIVYSGGIGPHRGVDTAIEAMQYLKPHDDIELIIIGSGSSDVLEHLNALSQKLEVTNHVHFLGHQSFAKFYSFMHLADVNIIPHKSNEHTDNTIPHKLFQSMMSGRPLLVSSSDPLKRLVNSTSSGLVFEANNPQDFASKILMLYNDRKLGETLGANGRQFTAEGILNWDTEQQTFIRFYETVFNQ